MRGKKGLLTVVSAISLWVVATPALAMMSAPVGWYIEGNVGSTGLSNKSYPGNPSSSGIGANANVGYKFMPYFGTELGYTYYAPTSITDRSTGNEAGTDRHWGLDLAFKGMAPIKETGLELFAKIGVDRQYSTVGISNSTAAANIGLTSNSHSAAGLYFAAGAAYYYSPQMGVNLQWARAQGNSSTGNLDLVSLGLTLIFG